MRHSGFARLGALLVTGLVTCGIFAAPSQANHQTTIGLTTSNQLAFFSVGSPQTAALDTITFPVGATDTDLVGIDYRPRSNLLYGYAAGGTLYALRPNPAPGITVATQVNPTPGADPTGGAFFGLDFNPVPDAIRVVSDTDENLRVSPDSGNVLGVDTPLTPSSDVVAAGYTNSFQGTTVSTLFGIDAAANTLVRQGGVDGTPSPNLGVLTTIGPLGVDTTLNAGFDIETSFGSATPLNTAYAALTPAATPTATNMYTVNLSTGAASLLGTGPIAGGTAIESIALPLTTSARFANALTQASEGAGTATVTIVRNGPGMSRAASIDYSTSIGPGDGASAADFTATTGTLNFPANVAAQSFTVPITPDTQVEGDERFQIDLTNPSSSLLLSFLNSSGKVLIVDNDDAPVTPVTPVTPTPQPGVKCGKGTVQKNGECIAKKKKKKKGKKKK